MVSSRASTSETLAYTYSTGTRHQLRTYRPVVKCLVKPRSEEHCVARQYAQLLFVKRANKDVEDVRVSCLFCDAAFQTDVSCMRGAASPARVQRDAPRPCLRRGRCVFSVAVRVCEGRSVRPWKTGFSLEMPIVKFSQFRHARNLPRALNDNWSRALYDEKPCVATTGRWPLGAPGATNGSRQTIVTFEPL